ncbi:MAG: 6-phosphofructokinase [Deltaproteobacteria bacterium]|jgi:6-phosphofructokinase|nr:6-phosphofructokinase [Deltaproteobacteria bacterium]
MAKLTGKALVAQGGGPTAVINQSVVGVVLEARRFPEITHVYGARHGVSGVLKEDFLDLSQTTTQNLEDVGVTPASALGSTRDKPDVEYCAKMFKVLQAHNIRYFFYIGGNDSSDTCRIVNEQARLTKYDLVCVHVPKTIDNDLVGTDHCPGFGSAAKFVAQAFAGANMDNRALPGVYIAVVMGRHAGFLTAASALGRRFEDDGPHLVYVPERPFDAENFVVDVQKVYDKHGRCIVAVSEGVSDKSGIPIITSLKGAEKDSHGNLQLSGTGALGDLLADLVKTKTKIKRIRADTLGYLQRSFLGCISATDAVEARAVGEKAVQFAAIHGADGSVAIKRVGDYAVSYDLIPLDAVAAKTRHMDDAFVNAEGNHVTPAFLKYCRPLAGELPTQDRIFAPAVAKIMNNK